MRFTVGLNHHSQAHLPGLRDLTTCKPCQAGLAVCLAAQCEAGGNAWLKVVASIHVWLCSAAAVVQRLSASNSLPAPDVAEALMLHVEACMPAVSQRLTTSNTISVQEQQITGAANKDSRGAAHAAEKGAYSLPVMQRLGQSWQALADVICQAGLEAVKAGISEAPSAVEPHNQLALVHPSDTSAIEHWNRITSLLESRAWWWNKAVFDADVQMSYLAAGQTGLDFACAMTIISDFMMREHNKLEGRASLLKNASRASQRSRGTAAGSSWALKKLKIAEKVLSRLK